MAQQNQININISDTDMQEIEAALDTLITKLGPHLKNLTPEDRKELPKMGDKTVAFVDKAREYAQQNPDLVPAYLDMSLFDNDIEGVRILNSISRHLQPLVENLDDSLMLSGSEAYQTALIFYSNVKVAMKAGVPNAHAIHDDLSSRFPGGSRSANKA
jgi:hypothetical protein